MKLNEITLTHNLKPIQVPDGFRLICDTREQLPLFTKLPAVVTTKLEHGDYSVAGFEDRIAIERKKLSDFYTYIGRERDKTQQKIAAMLHFDYVALVIEANEKDILSKQIYSKVPPETARQFLVSWNIRYGFHAYMNSKRKDCERWILDRLVKYYRLMREV